MNREDLVLHIGRNKSGTSSLQKFFSVNRNALSRHGYYYPATGIKGIAHHLLARHLIDIQKGMLAAGRRGPGDWRAFESPAARQCIDDLLEEIRGVEACVLISSEAFQNVRPALVAELFPPGRTRIVVYLREQLEYLLSCYAQAVHARKVAATLAEFETGFTANYKDFLDRWVRVYGKEMVAARIYERRRFEGGDVRKDFLGTLGVEDFDGFTFPTADQNPSISGSLLLFKRAVNAVSLLPEQELLQRLYLNLKSLAEEHPEFRGRSTVDSYLAREVRCKYRSSNAKMFRAYFPEKDGFCQKVFSTEALAGSDAEMQSDLERIWDFLDERDPEFVSGHYGPVMAELGFATVPRRPSSQR